MICRAIDQEQQGQSMVASAQARLGLLTSLAMQGADGMGVYNHAIRLMAIGYDLQQLHPVPEIQKAIDAPEDKSAYERMAGLLKALNSSDIKDRLSID